METLVLEPTEHDGGGPTAESDALEPQSGAPRDRSQRVAVGIVVTLLSLLFLANAASWLNSGFGESHDGRNASTWAAGSRAIREDGVITSRFGGRYQDQVYASHPPGIVAETTLAELVGGEHRIVSRAPAWIGSIAAAILLAMLLWELGLSAAAIAAGLCTALSSAMFLVYGTMLDTPMTALPFALAVVLVTQRVVDGRPVRPWVLGVLSLAVALSGWAAIAIAGVQALRLVLPSVRRRTGWRPVVAMGAGLSAGLAVSIAWGLWAYGSFTMMRTKLLDKQNSDTLAQAFVEQSHHLRDLLAVGIPLAVIGCAVAWIALPDRRWRGAFLSTLAAITVYAVVLKGGSAVHDYWNYALIVPIAIAVAAGAEALLRRAPADKQGQAQRATIVVALLFALLSSTYVSDAEATQLNALATVRLLDVAEEHAPPDGPVLAYIASRGLDSSWIPYEARRPGLPIRSTAVLEDLVAEHPGFPMLVPWVKYDPAVQDEAKEAAYAVDGPFAVVPAEFVLAQRTAG